MSKDQRMLISQEYIGQGISVSAVLKVTRIARSSYYNSLRIKVPIPEKRGRKGSQYTYKINGERVSNDEVIGHIKEVLSQEFVDYGYLKVTHWLRQEYGYIINPKKVYRLMKDQGLLNKHKPQKRSARNWVKELVPTPDGVFKHLEIDIKYMYVSGKRKNALILTVIDVKSRWVLGQIMKWSINHQDVKSLFDKIFEVYSMPETFYIRNDNGKQFEATAVQLYFSDRGASQEFCKPATPEQNAHIESYHSIVEKVVCQRYEFDDMEDGQKTMNRFVKFYNEQRIHSGIGYISPKKYLAKNDIYLNYDDIKIALDCSQEHINILV